MPTFFAFGSHFHSSGHGITLAGFLAVLAVIIAGRWLRRRLWPSNDEDEDRAMM